MEIKYITIVAFLLATIFCSSGFCSDQCPYSSGSSGPPSTVCNAKIHDCNAFNENVRGYKEKLRPFYDKVMSRQVLSANEVQTAMKIVNEYYNFLIKKNIVYGKLARDMVNNEGAFARIGNNHLKHRAKVEGKLGQLKNIENNLRIALAYSDAKLRSECTKFLPYKAIAKYHYDMFQYQGLSKLAWGGALFEEFAGSGSYLNAGGYDKSINLKITSLMNALIFNKESNGINAREALSSIKYIPFESFGDSVLAGIYRLLLAFKPAEKFLKRKSRSFSVANGYNFQEHLAQM